MKILTLVALIIFSTVSHSGDRIGNGAVLIPISHVLMTEKVLLTYEDLFFRNPDTQGEDVVFFRNVRNSYIRLRNFVGEYHSKGRIVVYSKFYSDLQAVMQWNSDLQSYYSDH